MSKYSPLIDYLKIQTPNEVRLPFADIEDIIGDSLPASAHNHLAWWSNQRSHPSHPWASQWMAAGWECTTVSLTEKWVIFRRAG